jgi:hypothetical protein
MPRCHRLAILEISETTVRHDGCIIRRPERDDAGSEDGGSEQESETGKTQGGWETDKSKEQF